MTTLELAPLADGFEAVTEAVEDVTEATQDFVEAFRVARAAQKARAGAQLLRGQARRVLPRTRPPKMTIRWEYDEDGNATPHLRVRRRPE